MATPNRIIQGTRQLSKAFKAGDETLIIIGGAAVILLGHRRNTKDIDGNFIRMKQEIKNELGKQNITIKDGNSSGRFSGNIPESFAGARDALSVDLAINPDFENLLEFTKTVEEGEIVVADERLMLMLKMKSLAKRSESAPNKQETDTLDLQFLISQIDLNAGGTKKALPQELRRLCTNLPWKIFWERFKVYSGTEDYHVFAPYLVNLVPEARIGDRVEGYPVT